MDMIALDKQYEFYLAHENELLQKYEGKYLVISEDLCVSAFDTKKDAFNFGVETYGLGKFLIQECSYAATHTVNYINLRMVA